MTFTYVFFFFHRRYFKPKKKEKEKEIEKKDMFSEIMAAIEQFDVMS